MRSTAVNHERPHATVPLPNVITTHHAIRAPITGAVVLTGATIGVRAIAVVRGRPPHAVARAMTGEVAAGATVPIRHAPTAATLQKAIHRAATPALVVAVVIHRATTRAHALTPLGVTVARAAAEAIPHQAGATVAEATLLQVEVAVAGVILLRAGVAAAGVVAVVAALPAQAKAAATS